MYGLKFLFSKKLTAPTVVYLCTIYIYKLNISDFLRPRIATMIKYGKVEAMPPTPVEVVKAVGQVGELVKSGITFKWLNLTTKVSIQ